MAVIRWPATLPQSLHIDTEHTGQSGFAATPMDQGAARRRRRFSSAIAELRPPKYSTKLTSAQKATLISFYESTLQNGALGFFWETGNEPIAGVGVGGAATEPAYQFVERPSFKGLKPDATAANVTWLVSWAFLMLPIGHPGFPEFA